MRGRILVVACLCVVGIAATPKARGRRPKVVKPGTVISKDAMVLPTMQRFDALLTPVWEVEADWSLELNESDQALYDQVAATLTGVSDIPNDRTNYYSAVNNTPGYTINGWTGLVNSVTPDGNGGYNVTVSVDPKLSTTQFGLYTDMESDYSEQYSINANNNVTYLGFLDPQGLAGLLTSFASD